jgi:hypothetical protein
MGLAKYLSACKTVSLEQEARAQWVQSSKVESGVVRTVDQLPVLRWAKNA